MSCPPFHTADVGDASPVVTSSEWATKIPNPLTYKDGLGAANKARQYAWSIVDKICSGSTCPPVSAIAPELVSKVKALDVVRDGLDAMVKRAGGSGRMPDKLRTILIARGTGVIDESDRIWTEAKRQDQSNRDKLSMASDFPWAKALAIAVGIYGAVKIVGYVRNTAEDVRVTVRGYPAT